MFPILLGPTAAQFLGRRASELWALLARPVPVPAFALIGEDDKCILPSTFDATMGPWKAAGGEVRVVPGGHFGHAEPGNEGVLLSHVRGLVRDIEKG